MRSLEPQNEYSREKVNLINIPNSPFLYSVLNKFFPTIAASIPAIIGLGQVTLD